jgi:Uri superfamily endonuclease
MNHSASGTYVVIAELPESMDIKIGRRGTGHFEKGFYGYVGSALNGLEKRLARHLGKRKRIHWHIDYLLNVAAVRTVIYVRTGEKKECLMARALAGKLASKPGFGCSDCNCPSHLFYCPDLEDLEASVLDSFKLLKLKPVKMV